MPPSRFRLPGNDSGLPPLMPPPERTGNAFLDRINNLTLSWIQEEWIVIDALVRETRKGRLSPSLVEAIAESRLTPDNLAKRLDNISPATLRRTLKYLNKGTPGELIRKARIAFAQHLLVHTRLLIRDIALRSGYSNEKSFSRTFLQETGQSPRQFRYKTVALSNGAATASSEDRVLSSKCT